MYVHVSKCMYMHLNASDYVYVPSHHSTCRRPFTQKSNEKVSWKFTVQHLGDEKQVCTQCSLQHNWHIGCVEQLNWIWFQFVSWVLD